MLLKEAWVCGDIIVADETMIFWTGGGEVHVVFITRKPTDRGIEMHTVCDGDSGIMTNAEIVEGKAVDHLKEYMAECGYPSTAVTLRLTKPWAGSGRIVVADSWFGSCRTAEWLWDIHGLHSVMSVKNGHSGYPKAAMKEALGGVREA